MECVLLDQIFTYVIVPPTVAKGVPVAVRKRFWISGIIADRLLS